MNIVTEFEKIKTLVNNLPTESGNDYDTIVEINEILYDILDSIDVNEIHAITNNEAVAKMVMNSITLTTEKFISRFVKLSPENNPVLMALQTNKNVLMKRQGDDTLLFTLEKSWELYLTPFELANILNEYPDVFIRKHNHVCKIILE